MAIQIPNPGTGNGATGDNEFVLWSKVKDNFSNTSHAASRLVGTDNGNVPVYYNATGISELGYGGQAAKTIDYDDVSSPSGLYRVMHSESPYKPTPTILFTSIERKWFGLSNFVDFAWAHGTSSKRAIYTRAVNPDDGNGLDTWAEFYTTDNADPHGTNGYLKPSSPILKVESERMWGNRDGDKMAATYTKKGVGHYEIAGTTGLRNDGWYIEIPNDLHGNPHVAVTIEDNEGNITLKSFKRVFNMDTFKFEPDLDNPLDIPEGRWIDLRFNDLPDEPMPQEV